MFRGSVVPVRRVVIVHLVGVVIVGDGLHVVVLLHHPPPVVGIRLQVVVVRVAR